MADSGDSSPLSAAATDDAHHDASNAPDPSAAAAQAQAVSVPPPSSLPPPPPAKVRLMVSYGGRIQPRPHDNQLSYVNGDTKILSIERPLRFPDFVARLAALAGTTTKAAAGEFCVKYQLPGEDLDALVSVTNDEDLDHLVIEYDRLHLFRGPGSGNGGGGGSSRGGSTPRLRVFLFPIVVQSLPQQLPPPPSPPRQINGLLPEPPKQEQREWYLDLRSVSPTPQQQQLFQSQQPKQEPLLVQSPPPPAVPMLMPQSVLVAPRAIPDYLCDGFDASFVLPPAVKVKDPAGEPPTMRENVPVEIPPKNEDRLPNTNNAADNNAMVAPAISPKELHRQIQEKLQFADNTFQQAPPAPAPAPVAAQQAPPAPAPVVTQQPTPAPAPVAAQQPQQVPAPATPAAQVAQAAPVTASLSRNGSDDSLTRAYPPAAATTTAPPEYYVPKFPEKPQVIPPSSASPAPAFLPVPGRYASVAPGNGADHGPIYFIPAPPHGYYASTNPAGTSYYAVAPHNGHNGNGNGTTPAPAMSNAQAYPQVAYDSNGRAVYYTGILPQYPSAVNGGMSSSAAVLGSEPSKPVAVVKPTVS